MLLLAHTLLLAHRYQLCNFSCPGGNNWTACRSEACDARLPEDLCADGSEATLADEKGLAVSAPQECTEMWNVSAIGSFAERCDVCMGLLGEVNTLWLKRERHAELVASAERLCSAAAERVASLLPTFRTCRLHASHCEQVVATSRDEACHSVFSMLSQPGGQSASSSAVRKEQQQLCGRLMTARGGSDVEDATVCAKPADVGARLMTITAVAATVLFTAQWFRV